jgi:hypothetical protein
VHDVKVSKFCKVFRCWEDDCEWQVVVGCLNEQPLFLCKKTLGSLIQDSPCAVSLGLWSSGLALHSLVYGCQNLWGICLLHLHTRNRGILIVKLCEVLLPYRDLLYKMQDCHGSENLNCLWCSFVDGYHCSGEPITFIFSVKVELINRNVAEHNI